MPDEALPSRTRERMHALAIVCVLTVASVLIALLGTTPARVGTTELFGDARTPGDAAFIASHRGGGATAPENTIPAISAALAAGFDYVEVDVALTSDGHAVLMHDASVDRTTDGHGLLADLTFEHVRSLDAGAWFDPSFRGTQVPTFAEFLDVLAETSRRALVELKGEWDAASVTRLADELAARDLEQRAILSSFDARTLALAAAASEETPRLLILKHLPDDVVRAITEAGARGMIASRASVLERPEVIDEAHAAGLRVVVYTLNSDDQWDAATALGVDGIVTDDPGTLSQWQQAVGGAR